MNLEKWHDLRAKTAELTVRERVILLFVCVILVLFLWSQFFYMQFETDLKAANKEIISLQQEAWSQKDELVKLTHRLSDDPNAALYEEQAKLKDQLAVLKEQIEIRLSHLIAPELMADVMRKVLSDYKGLRLVNAKNLPVEPLKLDIANQAANQNKLEQEDAQAVLFSHRFEMVLKGDYFQTLSFLMSLEQMEGFYWTLLKYEVDQYPKATVTLQLSTLSLDEDWIGV